MNIAKTIFFYKVKENRYPVNLIVISKSFVKYKLYSHSNHAETEGDTFLSVQDLKLT